MSETSRKKPIIGRLADDLKNELADLELGRVNSERIIRAAIKALANQIKNSEPGERVKIPGFGVFEVRITQERHGVAGFKGDRIDTVIPEFKRVTFKASVPIRQHLNPHMKVK